MSDHKRNDGGPAFPAFHQDSKPLSGSFDRTTVLQGGMTLRDYFAAQYVAGRAARGELDDFTESAELAYQLADAMLEAREAQ